MPSEVIGQYGFSQDASEAARDLEGAIARIKEMCGEPPAEMELQVGWGESDSGTYPIVELVWDDPTLDYPDEYIEKCILALESLES